MMLTMSPQLCLLVVVLAGMCSGEFQEPYHDCPRYVVEGAALNCTCAVANTGTKVTLLWVGVSNTSQLTVENVSRRNNGTVYTCRLTQGNQTSDTTYTLEVAYPPSQAPVISGYTDGQMLKAGDTISCSVAGGNPLVSQVIFSCYNLSDVTYASPVVSDQQDNKTLTAVTSSVTFSFTGLTDVTCVCSATWSPRPSLYTRTTGVSIGLQLVTVTAKAGEETRTISLKEVMTTEEARLITDEAAITTEEASITTEEAAITTEEAAITTEEAAITTEEAAITTEEASITTDEAAITTEAAAITTDEAAITTDKAAITTDEAAITTDEAAITTDEAAITTEAAAITTDEAAITTEEEASPSSTTEATTSEEAATTTTKIDFDTTTTATSDYIGATEDLPFTTFTNTVLLGQRCQERCSSCKRVTVHLKLVSGPVINPGSPVILK